MSHMTRFITTLALGATALFAANQTYAAASTTTLSKGVQVELLSRGTGPKASPSSTVTVHYEGTLANGTVLHTFIESMAIYG